MYVKLSWRPEVDENWAIMVVQPAILTYPTMVFYFWIAPRVIWNDLRAVPMAARITKYHNKYMRRGICLIYMSSFYFWSPPLARKMRKTNVLYSQEYQGSENIGKPSYFNLQPDIGFTLFTPIKGRIDSLTVYIYKAETCTNILRYNTCMYRQLQVLRVAWSTCVIPQNVCQCLCLITNPRRSFHVTRGAIQK
jgi:hypothetical protein